MIIVLLHVKCSLAITRTAMQEDATIHSPDTDSSWSSHTSSYSWNAHLLWDVDKDVFAPVWWRDEAVAFGAGKTLAHTVKQRTLRRTGRPAHTHTHRKRRGWEDTKVSGEERSVMSEHQPNTVIHRLHKIDQMKRWISIHIDQSNTSSHATVHKTELVHRLRQRNTTLTDAFKHIIQGSFSTHLELCYHSQCYYESQRIRLDI